MFNVSRGRHASLRYGHGPSQRRPRKLLCCSRFCEQIALHQIEAHLAHRNKVGPRLDAFRDTARAIAIGQVEDLTAHRAFQSVVGAPFDELSIDLELNEGKAVKPDE